MITLEEFDTVLDLARVAHRENPDWRWGQAVFNTLHALHRDEANSIRGTSLDMFYDEANIEKYKAHLDNEVQTDEPPGHPPNA